MPALIKTKHIGKIVWLGRVPDRDAALSSQPAQELQALYSGIVGEDHGGLTRPSCSRVVTQYPKGTDIRNTRQICIVSAEEMAAVAAEIGVDAFDPSWCGAGMVIEGIPDFTHIPPPCHLPAPYIDADAPGHGRGFKAAAKDRRGVTAWVEREGTLHVGDTVTLHIPAQRAWRPDS